MKRWGFRYKRADNITYFVDRPDVKQDCYKYLADFRRLIAMGYKAIFGDETWVPANHCSSKAWQWPEYRTDGAFNGFKGSMKIKSGAGERLILNSFIQEEGFIPNAIDLFAGKLGTGDYHLEMNGVHYEDYVKNQLAPNLPDKCMLIIDKASYHSVITEDSKYPTSSWRKADMLSWFQSRGISSTDDKPLEEWTVENLKDLAKKNKPPKKYVIDELLKRVPHSTGVGFKEIVVLRLPTKHCFLNPIELVWAYVKGYVARKNHTCKQADVLKLTREAIDNIPDGYVAKCYRHVEDLMKTFGNENNLPGQTTQIDPVIVSTASDSDSSDDQQSDSDHSDFFLGDSDLDLDTDEEVDMDDDDMELNKQQEVEQLQAINEVQAVDHGTRWPDKEKCSCTTGCLRLQCGCRAKHKKCSPACACAGKCYNSYQLLPGTEIRLSTASSSSTTPLETPPPLPPIAKRRKPIFRGKCKCDKSFCRNDNCICRLNRKICNPALCSCKGCVNTDADKLRWLPPPHSVAFRQPITADPTTADQTTTTTTTTSTTTATTTANNDDPFAFP